MLIICKECGAVDASNAIATPQVRCTTNWPLDYGVFGYCPECLKEYEVECSDCGVKYYEHLKNDMLSYELSSTCKTCKACKFKR